LFNHRDRQQLRGSDVVALKVEDIAPNGYVGWVDRDCPADEDFKPGEIRTDGL